MVSPDFREIRSMTSSVAREAAQRLGTSEDWLYRHAAELPFTKRLSERQLRFSSAGIEQYIRRRQN